MKLSAEQFAELLSSFGEGYSPGKFDNRRAARVELQAKVSIRLIISGQRAAEAEQVLTCDFSARGVSFVSKKLINNGQQFIMELPRKSGGLVEMLCRVVRLTQPATGIWRAGAEFVCSVQPIAPSSKQADALEVARIRESMMG